MVKKPTRNQPKPEEHFDIVVAGAGYVGLATALAVLSGAPDLKILIADAAPEGVWEKDGRASAIAAAATRMLDQLGCWSDLEPHAQPINDMIVTDSRNSDHVRPVFLTFAGDVAAGEPFAHMVPNVEMVRSLRNRLAEHDTTVQQGMAITGFTQDAAASKTEVTLADGRIIRTSLLIAADGVKSKLRDMAGIKTVHWDYGQSGIVATIRHERDHQGRAVEHFLPGGPFAILPLKGNRSSIVWTEPTSNANRLVEADDFTFDIELENRFGLELGEITLEGQKRAYPLGLTLARDFVAPRFALVGDAAHGIHPIAGQGLNLGFKDAAAIAETIVEAARLGQDIGAVDVLERYQRWRRFDTVQMGITTDILNRLFSNDIGPLRMVRDLGLGLVDRMPSMKNFFINQAAGRTGANPRLLQGEAI